MLVYGIKNINSWTQQALVTEFGALENFDDEEVPRQPSISRRATLKGLKKGDFSTIASDLVKQQDDFFCIICTIEFEDTDDCCELSCDEHHVFHSECLREWFKQDRSCPMCRKEV
mmetsp:Transcript_9591/g.11815  ORF Transcript_9591/g.11815 Transcript_9591/m.11815 type:complete len:115 (-) Transcript_9591:47-391(-)